MKHKKAVKTVSLVLAAALGLGAFSVLAGCQSGEKTLVIMTEELNGLFNPFYSTAGTDMDVVGQTQISMFNTDSKGEISYGDAEPVVVKDFMQQTLTEGGKQYTDYTFVLKNGIVFSDGTPLTMNDVLFNIYVYLDPAYTGSSTMYSTDIVGLNEYRTQQRTSDGGTANDEALTTGAAGRAKDRREELITAFKALDTKLDGNTPSPESYDAPIEDMRDFLKNEYNTSPAYKKAIWPNGTPTEGDAEALAREQILADYNEVVRLFEEELNNDYNAAKDAYQEPPYVPKAGKEGANDSDIKFDGPDKDFISFMYMEGYITLAFDRQMVDGVMKEDKNHIVKKNDIATSEKTYALALENSDPAVARENAIKFVLESKISNHLDQVLTLWATGSTVLGNYVGKAKDVILHERLKGGEKPYPNISGIQSLGHTTTEQKVSITHEDGTVKEYTVAHDYNADGTVKNAGEYAVLRIRINKIDPKAIWNFGLTIAPYHYYSDPAKYPIDIKANKFGLEWGSFSYHTDVLQGPNSHGVSKNKVPLGAGPYVATNRDGGDNPAANDFLSNNIVYYKANENFFANVEDAADTLHPPFIKRMNYQVVSSTNALYQLQSGSVHFVEPQLTKENGQTLQNMAKDGFESVNTWQLGYGYIGINAGKVPKLALRKAIMSAMNTTLAISYYNPGDAATIYWPMSLVSWAYPRTAGNTLDPANPLLNKEDNNGTDHDYTRFINDETAKANIRKYMQQAGVNANDRSALTFQFTIAGSNLTDHPCYNVMEHAKELLNDCGWNVEVISDVQALTKLATGSLTVWAAAWGSTIDPDMYQVYHKNSTATSVYAWGYREILANQTTYKEEMSILTSLSTLIEKARETNVIKDRADLYKQAMGKVLDLAVELPVYQRKTLYAYNANVIDKNSLPEEINSYTSPLSRIWEVKFA